MDATETIPGPNQLRPSRDGRRAAGRSSHVPARHGQPATECPAPPHDERDTPPAPARMRVKRRPHTTEGLHKTPAGLPASHSLDAILESIAIENARLVAAAHDQAVLEERQRLARDLHDSVTQALYSITLYAEAAARMLSSGDTARVAEHLHDLQDTAQEAFQEMRLLIFELRPPVLEQGGLVAALQARLDAVEGRSNLKTTLSVAGESSLPASVEQAFYRIAQEALNNILKHAHARHVRVSLRQERRTTVLEIVDDGIGFDLATTREQGGLGLRGMIERVAQLGGRLTLQSAPGAGTQVRIEVCL
jgi:signal transduction histidine kinase